MRPPVIIASAIGALISTLLLIMERASDHPVAWMEWQMPGINAAVLYWGAMGSSPFSGLVICWAVNAIVYAVAACIFVFAIAAILPRRA